ncbi:hypothetical protein V7S43_007900 [Phytophthora oleae]|uniref:Pectate lyase n=1 Tax=Phytophthora oleae TaxID=2107226 RepID=A0ABD3FJM7_9STRA
MATPALSIPYLRLVLAEGTVMTYTNPKPWTCLQIRTCSYWHRTASIYWKNLATKHYGIFYESNRCSTDKDYYFVSDIANPAGGNYTFKTKQVFGSMAVSVYKTEASFTFVDNCPSDNENTVLNESSVYLTSGSGRGSTEDGGLSSNWNDSLA